MFTVEDIEKMLNKLFLNLAGLTNGLSEKLIMTPGQAFGQEFWEKLLSISSKVFMPFALTLLALFLATELYNVYCKTNGEIDLQIASITLLKFIFPYLIITRSYDIIALIYKTFNSILINLNTQLIVDIIGEKVDTVAQIMQFVNEMNFGGRMTFWLQLFIIGIVVTIMQVIVTVIVYGRIFEIMLFWLVSPLQFATLVHNEHGQIGKNYIKMFLALILQGVLILLCIIIYSMLTKTIITSDATSSMVQLLTYSAILIVTITKVGQLSKRMLGTF